MRFVRRHLRNSSSIFIGSFLPTIWSLIIYSQTCHKEQIQVTSYPPLSIWLEVSAERVGSLDWNLGDFCLVAPLEEEPDLYKCTEPARSSCEVGHPLLGRLCSRRPTIRSGSRGENNGNHNADMIPKGRSTCDGHTWHCNWTKEACRIWPNASKPEKLPDWKQVSSSKNSQRNWEASSFSACDKCRALRSKMETGFTKRST